MKRLLSVLLVICLLSALFVPAASAAIEGACGVGLTWAFDEDTGVLTIEGTGDMMEIKSSGATPWADYASKIKRVELSEYMTSISDFAFYGCTALTNVVIPDSVQTIGTRAFAECESMVTAVIGSGVEELGTRVFSGCDNLLAVTFGGNDNLDVIPKATFEHSLYLEVVYFNGTEKQWKNIDIEGSNNISSKIVECLASVDEGTSGTTDWVFDHMNYTLTISGTGAMKDYSSLGDRPWDAYESYVHTVIVEDGVTDIADRAFGSFTNLDRAFIGKDVVSVGDQAFSSCKQLHDVYYGGSRDTWAAINVGSNNTDLTEANIHYAGECQHSSVNEVWTANGDETHTMKVVCAACGEEISSVTGACGDENTDGRCDLCGGEVAAKECAHPNATYEYVQNTEGVNHTKWLNCTDCGAHENMGVEDCTDVNLNYICDNCGATIEGGTGDGEDPEDPEDPTCAHTETTTETIYNNDNTHTTTVTCAAEGCGEVVSTTTADCTDDDIDYLCDVCEGQMEYVKYNYDVKTGTLTIYGNGAMDDYASGDDVPWAAIRSSITKVVVEEGVKHIGRRAFYNCAGLTEVTIPASMESVDNYAFYRCSGLKTVKYGGTEAMWSDIEIGLYNEALTNATREASCYHENVTETVVANEDLTHTVTTVCDDCGLTVSIETADCAGEESIKANNNGTHTAEVKCAVCEQTVSSETLACTAGEAKTTSNNDRTHTTTADCTICGGTASSVTENCTDGEDEGKNCDVCDFDLTCSHPTYVLGYNANGDHKTHTKAMNCTICGEEVYPMAEEDCAAESGWDCDLCGQDFSCQHDMGQTTRYEYIINDDRTHTVVTIVDCDNAACDVKELARRTADTTTPCTDEDDNDYCDVCGSNLTCAHTVTKIVYVCNGDFSHQMQIFCDICEDKLTDTRNTCVDRDTNGLCDVCNGACEHDFETVYTQISTEEKHNKVETCVWCRTVVTTTEACVDAHTHDGKCDDCAAVVVCSHVQTVSYETAENETHTVIKSCNVCEEAGCASCETFFETIADVPCTDKDHDQKCDDCQGSVICKMDTVTYVSNEDGTHRAECDLCDAAGEAEECVDEDADLYCDVCEYDMAEAVILEARFASVEAALAAAVDGDEIVLLKDAQLEEKLTIDKNVTLDFTGHTLTTVAVEENYSVIIKGDVTIVGGTFEVCGVYGIGVTGSLTVEGGEFNAAENNDYIIGNWGTLVISDGQFNGVYCAVNNFSGTTTITGGVFSTEETDFSGEYEASDLLADAGMNVSGGVFCKPVDETYCAEGYEPCENGDGTYGVREKITKFAMAGSNMTLGNELVVNVMFMKSKISGEGNVIEVTHGDVVTTIEQADWESYNAAMYVARIPVAAKEMADSLTVVVKNAEGDEISNVYTTSVREYAGKVLAGALTTYSQEMKNLAVDMLNYGAAAQANFSYNTEDMANKLLTEEQKAWATADVTCTNNQVKEVNCVGSNLSLESKILLNMMFKGADTTGMSAEISYIDYTGEAKTVALTAADFGKYGSFISITVDEIVLADAFSLVTVVIYNADGTLYGYGSDSVESYAARSSNDLNAAIMKFASSAKTYLGK